jgi:flagellar hook-length control protein FliK
MLVRSDDALAPEGAPAAELAADVLALVAADLRGAALAVPATSAGRPQSSGIVPSTGSYPGGAVATAIASGWGEQVPGPLRAPGLVPLDQAADVSQPERLPERVVTMPAEVSSVAAPVLAMLRSGTWPSQATNGLLPPGGPIDATLESTDPLARAADALAGLVSAEEFGATSESDAGDAFAGAATQLAQAAALRDGTSLVAHPRTLSGAVGTRAWQDSLGTEVRLLIERGASAATLRVSPEHLGPIEVRIDLADERASVWFTAAHPDTRAALADALPRLREMLSSVGVSLGEAGVQREAPGGTDRREGSSPGGAALPEANAESRVVLSQLDAGRGLVDEYA